jgi:D-alanyl-lipoteichoic acid acyltransferase DltB (MBOAT superfamily)
MTLSRWLRDYVYIPLGGSQRGRRRTYLNLLATMLLGGLWHGAAWTFVAWGAFLGIGLAIERWLTERKQDRSAWAMSTDATGERIFGSRVATVPLAQGARVWLGRLLTFHIVCLSWIFFRATSFHNAVDVLGRLFAFGGHHAPLHFWVVAIVVSALAVQVGPHVWSARIQAHFSRWTVWSQSLALAGALIAIDMMGPAGVAPFIYFRF